MIDFITADIVTWARAYTGPRFHGVLCDPPYHLTSGGNGNGGFMGKRWDGGSVAFQPDTWAAISECLVPGAHLLAFGGDRTHHRLMCAIEDAGFEIRTCIYWVFGSGFPKSLDVSKAIDKAAGAEREVIGDKLDKPGYHLHAGNGNGTYGNGNGLHAPGTDARMRAATITAPATDAARSWSGYGTALKPAAEIIVVARKPLDGTVAANCQAHGAGAINIDGCRVEGESWGSRPAIKMTSKGKKGGGFGQTQWEAIEGQRNDDKGIGRWPANLIHDGSAEVLAGFPNARSSGEYIKRFIPDPSHGAANIPLDGRDSPMYSDTGSAARFFYTAKASRAERDAGMTKRNGHPTLKPLSLCEYLARLILPPPVVQPRRILIPFAGTGSEALGAMRAGWDEITGVEMEQEYVDIAIARAKYWQGMMA